jgi:hypothetical protein
MKVTPDYELPLPMQLHKLLRLGMVTRSITDDFGAGRVILHRRCWQPPKPRPIGALTQQVICSRNNAGGFIGSSVY